MPTAPKVLFERDFLEDEDLLYSLLVGNIVWDTRMRARKTACFGQAYAYSGISYPTVPMHPALAPIAERLATRIGHPFNNCLLNFYENGDATMGFHSDSEEEIAEGTGVAIVSVGAERTLTFRSRQDRTAEFAYPLPGGSLLYMPPGIQEEWRHGVPKQEGVGGGRISLTFRQLREEDERRT
jgi:alkylated DNA repair dioxygenase AlkB